MGSKVLVNVRPNMTRVAYLENGELADLKLERKQSPTLVGSIFRGKVLRVLPGMQAAFIEMGLERSGFLYVGDVLENILANEELMGEPAAEGEGEALEIRDEGTKVFHRPVIRTPIQDLLKEGQILMVQVAKDPIGTKGARVTTQISLPGRQVVYMPKVEHVGVSRKIENESERDRLKSVVEELGPSGGVIVRTAGEGSSAEDLKTDLNYLKKVWKDVDQSYGKKKSLGLVYSDLGVELRTLRDILSDDVEQVVVDDAGIHKKVIQFIKQFLPSFKNKVELYEGAEPLFDRYDIDIEVSRSLNRKIWLKSGGYIVIDEAEALVVIDVNTGRFVGKKDLEDTILKTNLEAVKEICHQLRIRNCGGIVILDLIDMEKAVNREKVLQQLDVELKRDRARTAVISMSELGLVEMTRKRIRPSLVSTLCEPCPYCDGRAYIKQKSTVANEIFRSIEREVALAQSHSVELTVKCHPTVADWIYEQEGEMLEFVENKAQSGLHIEVEPSFHVEEYEIRRV